MIWKVVLGWSLKVVEILLVPDLLGGATLDSLRAMFFQWTALIVDQEGVHLRLQTNKLGDRFAVRLVLEFADHIVGRASKNGLALSN